MGSCGHSNVTLDTKHVVSHVVDERCLLRSGWRRVTGAGADLCCAETTVAYCRHGRWGCRFGHYTGLCVCCWRRRRVGGYQRAGADHCSAGTTANARPTGRGGTRVGSSPWLACGQVAAAGGLRLRLRLRLRLSGWLAPHQTHDKHEVGRFGLRLSGW